MEQPKKETSASEHRDKTADTTLPEPTKMQLHRWKDDGGAIPPDPRPE